MSYIELRWMPDLKAEADLAALSIAYEIQSIPFSKIDLKESQYNGARLDTPIIASLVEDYAMAMENGDPFPRIIVFNAPTGYIISWGNQRTAAVKSLIDAGKVSPKTALEAYVVQTTDKLLLDVLARCGNVGHGGRSPKEERIAHALHAVRNLGMTASDAAKLFIVSDSTILQYIRADEERKFQLSQGINVAEVTNGVLNEIARVADLGLKTKLGSLASQHGKRLPVERVRQAVQALKKSRSQSAQHSIVKGLERELSEAAHRAYSKGRKTPSSGQTKVPRRPRRDRIITLLTQLANFLETGLDGEPFRRLSDLQVSGDIDRKTIIGLWMRVDAKMHQLLREK
jgi:hypothetical protein